MNRLLSNGATQYRKAKGTVSHSINRNKESDQSTIMSFNQHTKRILQSIDDKKNFFQLANQNCKLLNSYNLLMLDYENLKRENIQMRAKISQLIKNHQQESASQQRLSKNRGSVHLPVPQVQQYPQQIMQLKKRYAQQKEYSKQQKLKTKAQLRQLMLKYEEINAEHRNDMKLAHTTIENLRLQNSSLTEELQKQKLKSSQLQTDLQEIYEKCPKMTFDALKDKIKSCQNWAKILEEESLELKSKLYARQAASNCKEEKEETVRMMLHVNQKNLKKVQAEKKEIQKKYKEALHSKAQKYNATKEKLESKLEFYKKKLRKYLGIIENQQKEIQEIIQVNEDQKQIFKNKILLSKEKQKRFNRMKSQYINVKTQNERLSLEKDGKKKDKEMKLISTQQNFISSQENNAFSENEEEEEKCRPRKMLLLTKSTEKIAHKTPQPRPYENFKGKKHSYNHLLIP